MEYKIIPIKNLDITVEGESAIDALINFATTMDLDMGQYFRAVPTDATTTAEMRKLKEGDRFVMPNGDTHTASADAHYNTDEECWIVYDEDNNSWFEDDFIYPDIIEIGLDDSEK